ncbi:hypothetical protein BKA82DRAFT_999761 [Pisolithus tinctorius]|uniref:Uncharacterized protein n=1 Tax=Pisolithus tinctorius Marx 270 TaxID=870435 RepID=A0A0C3PC84_PISTI|nr:hypothetical protein BKA82DRAFT_999761 [Pisolithus tinctorius]KIO05636.1 hypothetical protein M404DRAFT_999761 [Pisolithus tinctorius Marx 270]
MTQMGARDALDVQVAKAAGEPSVNSFACLLGVIGEGIEEPRLSIGQCKSLIHLKRVTTGTLKVDQAFELKEHYHYLELIAKHCSDRVAAVHSVDVGSIWSLLCKML